MSLATDSLASTAITPARHEFLDMSAPDAAAAWDDLLSLQVELSFPHELSFFLESTEFASADSVLDVGCGNGDYLARLARFFPRPQWTGIDCAPEMIASARRRWPEPRLTFLLSDFFAFRPDTHHDVILMRLIVQHLSDLASVLAHASDCLAPSGRLYLIEPDLENTFTTPRLPAFEGMIREHEMATARHGRLRSRISDIPQIAEQSGAWVVVAERRIGVPWIGPFANGKIARMYLRWIELCERSATFRYPFARVRTEITEWSSLSASFARFGIRILELSRS